MIIAWVFPHGFIYIFWLVEKKISETIKRNLIGYARHMPFEQRNLMQSFTCVVRIPKMFLLVNMAIAIYLRKCVTFVLIAANCVQLLFWLGMLKEAIKPPNSSAPFSHEMKAAPIRFRLTHNIDQRTSLNRRTLQKTWTEKYSIRAPFSQGFLRYAWMYSVPIR